MIHEKGAMHQVKCKICTFIEGKEKLLAPKLNNLLKYVVCKFLFGVLGRC
jgi:hypothetical protein